MPFWNRKPAPEPGPGLIAVARFVRRDSDLDSVLREGDAAVIDVADLDRRHAEALIEHKVRAVVNVSPSSTGRFPNLGPRMLARAGITLVDGVGPEVWKLLRDGGPIRVEHGQVYRDEVLVASGVEHGEERAEAELAAAESGLATRLDSLAANASDHLQREQAMLLEGVSVPELRTDLAGRGVVVVSNTFDAAADLRSLRRYIVDHDPVLVGAGAGADLLLDAGYTPSLVVGSMDSLSDRALKECGEVVITSAMGRVENPERLEKHGKEIVQFVATGSDEDLALLLADTRDAAVIVHVGGPPTLVDFLERGPVDVASSFIARLRAGTKIVDAKAVEHFSSNRLALWPLLLLLLCGVAAVVVAVAITPVGDDWFDSLGERFADLGSWIKGLFS